MALIDDQIMRSKRFMLSDQEYWYSILKDNGFIDIELIDPKNGRARGHLSTRSTVSGVELTEDSEQHGTVIDPSGKMQYYQHASELNHIKLDDGYHVFESYDDQRMWGYHSEGMSAKKISEILDIPRSTIDYRINKYKPLLSNKLLLPSVKEVNNPGNFRFSEDSEYEVVDYCKDPLKTTEDVMVNKIDRDRDGIRTREIGYYEDIEEGLRNRYTGWRLAERLVWLDDEKQNSLRVRQEDKENVG